MTVSVITATYNILETDNGAAYFVQMFESIHNQTHDKIEHIIIDGASNDKTVEFIKKLISSKKSSFTVKLFSEPDLGIYDAMNKGVRKATGDYIIFMNSDDYFLSNDSIKILVDACENNKCDFSCSATKVFYSNGKIKSFKPKINSALYRMPFCHQSMLCKKNLFEKYGFFDINFKITADYDFILKLISSNVKGVEINKELVFLDGLELLI